jgi:hypothetical protein
MNSPKTPVSLEDLLRLKRLETPPAEFWSQFDRELRAKQLAAIVEPRPWWAPLIRVGARVSHLQLPLGAAAILVVSFVTLREYSSPELIPVDQPVIAARMDAVHAPVAQPDEAYATYRNETLAAEIDTTPGALELDDAAAVLTEMSSFALAENAEPAPSAVSSEPSPSERYIAANLAAAQAADPSLMDEVFGPSARTSQLKQPMRDPLAQVTASGESRRARLLATALPVNATSSDLVIGAKDRVARDLTEQRLYDTISRVGLKGDRVALKL